MVTTMPRLCASFAAPVARGGRGGGGGGGARTSSAAAAWCCWRRSPFAPSSASSPLSTTATTSAHSRSYSSQPLQHPSVSRLRLRARPRPRSGPDHGAAGAGIGLGALLPLTFRRQASHKQQASVNGPKNGPGKRLGAKKAGGLCLFSSFYLLYYLFIFVQIKNPFFNSLPALYPSFFK